MAADMFLKISGIDGESQDSSHSGEIEISSYSLGVSQQGTMGSGMGGGAGKARFSDLHVTKRLDKASPNLFVACATGKHIDSALLTVRKAGGDQVEYLKVTMTDCIVSSYQESGAEGAIPLESVSFNFAKVKFEYSPQNADGSLAAAITGGYDVKKQEKIG